MRWGHAPPVDPPTPEENPFGEQPAGNYLFQCLNENDENYFHVINDQPPPPREPYVPPFIGDICVSVDPSDEPDPTEGGGGWEAVVREKCTAVCAGLNVGLVENNVELYPHHCSDGGWTLVRPVYNYIYGSWPTCTNPTALLDFDLIEDILGAGAAADAAELPCDLADDCADYLDLDEKRGLWTPADAETRYTADVQLETDPGESNVIIAGVSRGMEGHAAYTATSCGEDACPFYLAQMELTAVSSMSVTVSLPTGSLTKTISDLSISLEHPALGMWLPNSDLVIIPSNAMRINVQATVSGSSNPYGENGTYDRTYFVDEEYVFGILDGADLILAISGEDYLGDWSVYGQFVEE